jgi:hypothetical protein
MANQKLNPELPLLNLKDMATEANKIPDNPWEYPNGIEDVVVLVLDRASVSFESHDNISTACDNVKIKSDPRVLAVACLQGDGEIYNSARRCNDFNSRLREKTFLAFKALIGSMGIYPFKRIWALTTPFSWRGEDDVELKPQELNDDFQPVESG